MSIRCKVCFRTYEASPERRAKRTRNTLQTRVRLQAAYANVEIRMTREDFLTWAIPEYTAWMVANPGKTPSLDRIKVAKHYQLGNLRILERGENSRLASNHPNVHAPSGKAWCGGRCKTYKNRSEFQKCRSNFNGLQKRCRQCQNSATTRRSRRGR